MSVDRLMDKPSMEHTKECYPVLRRNEILIHAVPWTDLKNIKLDEIRKTQRNQSSMILSQRELRIGKFIQVESRWLPEAEGRRRTGSYCLADTGFLFGGMQSPGNGQRCEEHNTFEHINATEPHTSQQLKWYMLYFFKCEVFFVPPRNK